MSARVLLPPMPPMPTVAMFTVSLGAWNPRPSTCRGTMVRAAPAPAAVLTNFRLVTSVMTLSFLEAGPIRSDAQRVYTVEGPAILLRFGWDGRGCPHPSPGPERGGADVAGADDQQQRAEAGEEREVLPYPADHRAEQVRPVVARQRGGVLDRRSEQQPRAQDRAEHQQRVERRLRGAALEPDRADRNGIADRQQRQQRGDDQPRTPDLDARHHPVRDERHREHRGDRERRHDPRGAPQQRELDDRLRLEQHEPGAQQEKLPRPSPVLAAERREDDDGGDDEDEREREAVVPGQMTVAHVEERPVVRR